jgi:serine/threonine protein kinase
MNSPPLTVPDVSILSVADLERFLTENSLVPQEEIQALPAEQRADAKAVAEALVRQQKLTPYQSIKILEGAGNGLLLGNYIILDKLGQGGMGMVFKARHRRMDRLVALKVLPPALVQAPGAVQRFQREAKAAAKLSHPNIVAAYDADEFEGSHFLVMEYVVGADLSQLVKKQGPLPVRQVTACILQAARGLQHAHEAGVIHRDIKPANLLLDIHGVVKILDMGLARIEGGANSTRPDELTQSGSIMGTCDYMAPEQALNTRKADHRADIYSLGCTLYYLITGKAMYAGETSMEKLIAHRQDPIPPLPGVAAKLQAIYQRMVAKNVDERYQSMTQVITELETIKGVGDTEAHIETPELSGPPPAMDREDHTVPISPTIDVSMSEIEVQNQPRPTGKAPPDDKTQTGDKTEPPAPAAAPTPTAAAVPAQPSRRREFLMYTGIAVLFVLGLTAIALLREPRGKRRGTVTTTTNNPVVVQDVPQEQPPPPPNEAAPSLVALAFAPNTRELVSSTIASGTKFRNTSRPEEAARLLNKEPFARLAFSPDGSTVAGASWNGEVHLWDTRTGEERGALPAAQSRPWALTFGPDGLSLFEARLAGKQPQLRIWNLAMKSAIGWQPAEPAADSTNVMALSPAGRLLACAGEDQRIRIWNVRTGLLLKTLEGHQVQVAALAFSVDGGLLASGDSAGRVRIWDTTTGVEKVAFGAHPHGGVTCLAFTPDGFRLVTGSGDATARIWEALAGRELGVFRGHKKAVLAAAISFDGKLLATASQDMAVKVWDIPPRSKKAKP